MARSRRSLLRGVGGVGASGAVGAFLYGRSRSAKSTEIDALVAGSLLRVTGEIPGAAIEAHGSAAVRRLILNGLREPDAVALADPRLFSGIAERATLFATNALVLAYDPRSPHANAIERDWRRAVERDAVTIGRTDPALDPLGYRTVMALRLAERIEGIDVDAERVLDDSRMLPETELLSALAGGALDAAFAYRSMATERGLAYRSLPARIDFSDPTRTEEYASVAYDLDGKSIPGAPIRYGVAATTADGRAWVDRLVAAGERLREAGFTVPREYPIRDANLEAGRGA